MARRGEARRGKARRGKARRGGGVRMKENTCLTICMKMRGVQRQRNVFSIDTFQDFFALKKRVLFFSEKLNDLKNTRFY